MKGYRWVGLGLLLAALLVVLAVRFPDAWNVFASPSHVVRDISVVARGMTFEIAGQSNAANTDIAVTAGERLRITVRNEAAGIAHDFAIPEWGVATPLLATGESAQLLVDVPSGAGEASYQCNPHAQMMRGTIRVSDPVASRSKQP